MKPGSADKPAVHAITCTCWRCLDADRVERGPSPWRAIFILCMLTWALIGAGVHAVIIWAAS